MTGRAEGRRQAPGAVWGNPALLWAVAAAVAGVGSWILYDARPGINWFLWTGAAVAGLLAFSRLRRRPARSVLLTGGAPVVIAGGAAVTASPRVSALIAIAIVFLLAIEMLLAAGLSLRAITPRFALSAPLVALRIAVVQTIRHGADATHLTRSTPARAWIRGVAITAPVLIAFALLLAAADPVFAEWRDAIGALAGRWEFVPRVVFFVALLVVVLGAYGYAWIGSGDPLPTAGSAPSRWLPPTERVILLAGVATLFWLFLALQVGYLFGDLPRTPAAGMTFAEYARRGFGELSIVASASALLIVVSERYGSDGAHTRALRLLTVAVIAAVFLLLGSAFHRVWLYEAAYGFTAARLYAQVYMGAVAAGLAMLTLEVVGDFDADRLFRRTAAAATILFTALIYWNHEGWIASRNIDRFASTGKLDVAYLTRGLSSDAIPAIAQRLPALPGPVRADVRRAVRQRYATRGEPRERAWFEWNLASSRARQALAASFATP